MVDLSEFLVSFPPVQNIQKLASSYV